MDRSGPGCRKADSDFTGELGCRTGHEGSHLFMPDLHEVDGAFCSIQCRHEAADAVSGIAEHPPHAPGVEAHPEEIRNGLGHGHLLGWGTTFKQIRCCCALLGRRTSDVREWDHLRYSGAQGSPSSAPNTLVKSATLSFGTATARAGIGTGLLRGSFPACMVECFLPSHSSTHDLTRWLLPIQLPSARFGMPSSPRSAQSRS